MSILKKSESHLKMNEQYLIDKLTKARFMVFTQEPFLGYILQQYPIFFDNSIKTAATDGYKIIFNQEFLKSLSLEETMFILCHEVLHIILDHLNRKKDRDRMLFNVACDIVINSILSSMKISCGKLNVLDGYKICKLKGSYFSAEYVYQKLPKDFLGETIDSHQLWEDYTTSNEQVKDYIQRALKKGYRCSHRMINRSIALYEKKANTTQWRYVLNQYLIYKESDYTFDKLDYRYSDILLPDFNKHKEELDKIWFCVDVSGSMSIDDIGQQYQIISNIISIYPSMACDISFFSTEITKPKVFRNKNELQENFKKIKSSGGTSFQCIFQGYNSFYRSKKPIAMIVMTDGHSEYPEKTSVPKIPIIWAINNQEEVPPYGKIIYI